MEADLNLSLVVEVIERIENPGLFFAELARLLKSGGLALFISPNLHAVQSKPYFPSRIASNTLTSSMILPALCLLYCC